MGLEAGTTHTPVEGCLRPGAVAVPDPSPCLYDPTLHLDLGSTTVDIGMADLGASSSESAPPVTSCGTAAPAPGPRDWVLWCGAALCAWIVVATLYGPQVSDTYPLAGSLVSAATFAEYALLALAGAVLIRSWADVLVVVIAFASSQPPPRSGLRSSSSAS